MTINQTEEPQPTISDDEIRAMITSTSGSEFIPPDEYSLPEPDSYNLDPETATAVNFFQSYLGMPIIKDEFSDHGERRNWRFQTGEVIRERYGEQARNRFEQILGENKMKINKLFTLIGWVDLIQDELPTDLVNRFMMEGTKFIRREGQEDPWNGPTTTYKIEVVRNVSNLTAEALRHLATLNQPDQ